MYGTKRLIAGVALLSSLLFLGTRDPGHQLVGGYYLERFDEGDTWYFVHSDGDELNSNDVFDGMIQEIGWNENWILARVERHYGGDPDGWFALNVKTRQVLGPLQDSDLETDLIFSKIRTIEPGRIFSGNN